MRAPSLSVLRPRKPFAQLPGARHFGRIRFFLPRRMEPMKKSLGLVLLELLFWGLSVSAQTVSPVIVECGKKCSGAFSVTNNGLTPLAVTVEARSFSMDPQGHATYRSLDAAADLKLDEGSARIAPKGISSWK